MTDESAYSRLSRGAGLVFLGNVFGMVLSFATRAGPAAVLDPGSYGRYTLAVTLILVLGMVGRAGLPEGLARELSRSVDQASTFLVALGSVAAGSTAVALATVLFTDFVVAATVGPAFRQYVPLVAVGVPAVAVTKVVSGGLRGVEDMAGRVLVENVLMRAGIAFPVAVALASGYGGLGAAAGWVVGLSISAIGGVALLARRTALLARPKLSDWAPTARGLLSFSVPLMGANTAWLLLHHTDTLLVGYYTTSSSLGTYEAAFTLSKLIQLGLWPIGIVVLPIVSKLDDEGDYAEIRSIYALSTKWVALLTIPVVVITLASGGELLETLFGPTYTSGRVVLSILTAAFFVHVILGSNREALVALGHPRLVFTVVAAGLSVNVFGNVLLVPTFGIDGAALASGGAFVSMNALFGWQLYSNYGVSPFSRPLGKAVTVAGGVLVVSALFLRVTLGPSLLVVVCLLGLSLTVYPALAVWIGLEPTDAVLLRQADERVPFDLSRLVTLAEARS